ncbi:hypothetical protein, partial [Stenotrophomonas pictorum]|uniref:hypothetical protein n=1 Tax=Stenotrophomonas pictorum TaxID=86184 RepID=UPI001C455634
MSLIPGQVRHRPSAGHKRATARTGWWRKNGIKMRVPGGAMNLARRQAGRRVYCHTHEKSDPEVASFSCLRRCPLSPGLARV